MDIEKAVVSNKIFSGEKNYKCFIGYLHNDHKIKLLYIMLPKTSGYVKSYDGQTKWMYFLVEDHDLLEKYNNICNKVSAYKKTIFKTKIKSHGHGVTDFYVKKISKVDSNYTCLAVISSLSASKMKLIIRK